MRRLLYLLLALLGFVVSSCRVEEYGCPPVEYDEEKEHSQNNTERVEPHSGDQY